MTQANSSTINHYQQLTAEERGEIEAYLNTDMSQADIARRLHRSRSTISREIKRGTVQQRNSDGSGAKFTQGECILYHELKLEVFR